MILRILAVGDVVGAPGLTFLTERLRAFQEQEHIDFTVVNGENANVVGVTPKQADAIFAAGADVITLGNHTWTRYELQPYLEQKKRILRPANFAPQCPGRGWGEYSVRGGPICVINLMGRFTLDANTDNPFLVADDILDQTQAKIVLVDMHAEATSEKRAMGFYLDGRVTAVWGTHTHVQTSDAEVLPEGTGYLTDLGMTGPATPCSASRRSSRSASSSATRRGAMRPPWARPSSRARSSRSTATPAAAATCSWCA